MSDYSLTTFGASGELTQVRYALTAVGNGETCLGIKAKNGCVIAAEKKITSPLVDESSIHKIEALSDKGFKKSVEKYRDDTSMATIVGRK